MRTVACLFALLLAGSAGFAQDRPGRSTPAARGYKHFERSHPGAWSGRGHGHFYRDPRPPYGRFYKTPPYRHYPSYHGYYPSYPYGYRRPARPWIHAHPRHFAPYRAYYPPYYPYPCR